MINTKPLNDVDIITNATKFKMFLNKYYYNEGTINSMVNFINQNSQSTSVSFDKSNNEIQIKTNNPTNAINLLYTYMKNQYMQIETLMHNTIKEYEWDDKLTDIKYIVSDNLMSLLFKTSYINNYLYIRI